MDKKRKKAQSLKDSRAAKLRVSFASQVHTAESRNPLSPRESSIALRAAIQSSLTAQAPVSAAPDADFSRMPAHPSPDTAGPPPGVANLSSDAVDPPAGTAAPSPHAAQLPRTPACPPLDHHHGLFCLSSRPAMA
ncbi:hypothetical protein KCU62_g7163, partial [Aureobasidium sp. EXF-3399]